MVELKGSEKQIKWGKDIQVMISKMEEQFNLAVNSILEKGNTEEDLSRSGYDVNEVKESFKAIHECEEAKTLIKSREN